MPPAAGPGPHSDHTPANSSPASQNPPPAMFSESFAKDAIIAWFRGEFAAANAIIDALCSHIKLLEGVADAGSEYDAVFAAVHRRRMNWIPILQMQKFFSIADVASELKKVTERKLARKREEELNFSEKAKSQEGSVDEILENGSVQVVDEDLTRDDLPESEITDTGSQEMQPSLETTNICSNHGDCDARLAQIKVTKGFVAKEPVKGHMVNVVKGLKLYDDIFNHLELSKLNDLVSELRAAGQNGELSGETFILYNQQIKGNKRELIQLGVPIFRHIKDTTSQKSHIEPIPAILEGVIEHLIQWHIISGSRKPNSCIINYFDEGEYSQPFLKPPHLDQPVCTLLLSESTMAFGRALVNNNEGNYKGSLMLSLDEGSLLVMRGNSADMARHAMCSGPNKRITITFFKVRLEKDNNFSAAAPISRSMTLWQPAAPNGLISGYEAANVIPKWGLVRAPVVMLAPMSPVAMSPRRMSGGGTGVFLPWTVGSRKHPKHLPPRAQKARLLALPSSVETHEAETNRNPNINLKNVCV